MAINVKQLVQRIRYKTNDFDELKYSDYDILEALNECLDYLNQDKALRSSDFLEKIKRYRQDEMNAEVAAYNEEHPEEPKELYDFPVTGAELPDDLIKFVDITRAKDGYHLHPIPAVENIDPHYRGQYKVFAGRIYTNTDFDLLYRAKIRLLEFSALGDENAIVELPEFLRELLVKVTIMILTNNPEGDALLQEINRVTSNLIPGRRYKNVKSRMPWKV